MKYQTILILMVACLILSVGLAINEQDGNLCGEGEGSSCSAVNESNYSQLLGVNNSYLGIPIFLFMIVLIYSHLRKPNSFKKTLIYLSITIGALISIYFLYLQAMIIGYFCQYCTLIDFALILSFVLLFIRKRRRY
jgi:uncharacterized membrane protein